MSDIDTATVRLYYTTTEADVPINHTRVTVIDESDNQTHHYNIPSIFTSEEFEAGYMAAVHELNVFDYELVGQWPDYRLQKES